MDLTQFYKKDKALDIMVENKFEPINIIEMLEVKQVVDFVLDNPNCTEDEAMAVFKAHGDFIFNFKRND